MADEHHVVRGVSWNEIFAFSNIFKSFKMAIHPSKIILALLAIVLTCVLGVVMDRIWSAASDSAVVVRTEAWGLWAAPSRSAFEKDRQRWLTETRVMSLTSMLARVSDLSSEEAAKLAGDDFHEGIERMDKSLAKSYAKALEAVDADFESEQDRIDKLPGEKERSKQAKRAQRAMIEAKRGALQTYLASSAKLRELEGEGIFEGLLHWEKQSVSNLIGAVRRGNFATGVGDVLSQWGSMTPAATRAAAANIPPFDASTNDPEGYGVIVWLAMMAWGVCWMISTHYFYALIFLVVALAIWSVLGGAVCRIAALHAAREEKISMSAAVKFSLSKFLSFLTAPLLPIGIAAVFLVVPLALGGLLGAIPGFGEWFVALFFWVALLLGAVMAFIAIGLAGGGPLMWPTIAVEGSDSFDAISRSFNYVIARPFRYGLYWLVAAVYGTFCYLFVRLFAFIGLLAVHFWTGWAMKAASRPTYADGAGKLDVMWAQPTFNSFQGPLQLEPMNGSEYAASAVLSLWVYLVGALVAAFLACFFFSAATNIYYLLRRKIDATDLDDVYVEETVDEMSPDDEEPVEPVTEPPAVEEPAPGEENEKPAEEEKPGESDESIEG